MTKLLVGFFTFLIIILIGIVLLATNTSMEAGIPLLILGVVGELYVVYFYYKRKSTSIAIDG